MGFPDGSGKRDAPIGQGKKTKKQKKQKNKKTKGPYHRSVIIINI
jgi:hypothetical protein